MREIDNWFLILLVLATGVIIAALAFLWRIGHPPPPKGE
jgi:hypothetical protein